MRTSHCRTVLWLTGWLLCAAGVAATPETLAQLPVKEVTVFKDGHAFVVHDGHAPVQPDGDVVMDRLPARGPRS